MKIAYITVKAPFGRGETFLFPEILETIRQSHDVTIVPFRPETENYHQVEELENHSINTGLLSAEVLKAFFTVAIRRPGLMLSTLFEIFVRSRSPYVGLKNLSAIPKAFYCTELFRRIGVEHIHAHWGGRTSTMAYIVSRFTSIPWSFTLHRWDILENNLLLEKSGSADFVRCISDDGKKYLLSIVGEGFSSKVKVIKMGVDLPVLSARLLPGSGMSRSSENMIFVTPGNLLPVKGHLYLIAAVKLLVGKGITGFKCEVYGDGPLEKPLKAEIAKNGLDVFIELRGRAAHNELLDLYRHRTVDCVVLPSIDEGGGSHEGIPVSLVEAMAHGIPVISTKTGGIPELIGKGEGIMVEDKNAPALAAAMEMLMGDTQLRKRLSILGREKVETDFSVAMTVRQITTHMRQQAPSKAGMEMAV
jgi:glycosyltransferase involved in cell wall biosynthesis